MQFEITTLLKQDGPLTKRIYLSDGKPISDGSDCRMSTGVAGRKNITTMKELSDWLTCLESTEAIALGVLRDGLPELVEIITKDRIDPTKPDIVARTVNNFVYRANVPAAALLDHDQKGMTPKVAARLNEMGGFEEAIKQIIGGFDGIAYLSRASTSAGLSRSDTGEEFHGSGGKHMYLVAKDGADIGRFLRVLHDRCWLNGLGWYIIGAAGQLLDRSIVDRMVGSPERLVFEGPPMLEYPLVQNAEMRRPVYVEGEVLDTFQAMPPLSQDDRKELDRLRRQEEAVLQEEAEKVKADFIQRHAEELVSRTGMSLEDAQRVIAQQCEHILLGAIKLPFDDPALEGTTVADVIANPGRYEGETLADPIEGVVYGRGKAKLLLRHNNGKPFVRSFAHGGATYQMRLDDAPSGVNRDDFWAYMPTHVYIFAPTREVWPALSVNSRIPPVPLTDRQGNPILDDDHKSIKLPANAWLDRYQPVEQMTWAPGLPLVIRHKMIHEGGWIDRRDVSIFNLYRPPTIELGDASKAGRWVELVEYLYPKDVKHILDYLGQRCQHPNIKPNHALVLIGGPGIGKDTILAALRFAVGAWNCQEVSPSDIFGTFNGYLRSVVLKINEAHDLGDFNRFQFYDRLKVYTASPPDVLRVNDKYLRHVMLMNCCGVVITTNHKTDGLYLPADDRRHYIASSDRTMADDKFRGNYWQDHYEWCESGGYEHIAAYLMERDISGFNPKAPPQKTEAFWEIIDANRAPEEAEMMDAIDNLLNPDALRLDSLVMSATDLGNLDLAHWLKDPKNRRSIPHRLAQCGYSNVPNQTVKDRQWIVDGSRQRIYAKVELSNEHREKAASKLVKAREPVIFARR